MKAVIRYVVRAAPTLSAVLVASLLQVLPLSAQADASQPATTKEMTALVTFVDNGGSLTGGLPKQKSQAFRGKLFLEDRLLANMQPANFVTFAFAAVPVEFTAQTWMATGPLGGAHLTLNLAAGKHYFVELRTKQAWPATKMFGIKEITCNQAKEEHEHDQPLDSSHIKLHGDPALVAETSFPGCS